MSLAPATQKKLKKELVNGLSIKEDVKVLEKELKEINGSILESLTKYEEKSYSTVTEDDEGKEKVIKVTVVAPEKATVDPEALEAAIKKIDPKLWLKVTERTLSHEKLKAAVDKGLIDPQVIASVTEVKPTAKYLKWS